ncbi:MAG: FKBP-type peptidyl-prolyl cis-trans isomerase [Planctomycetia bacterium]
MRNALIVAAALALAPLGALKVEAAEPIPADAAAPVTLPSGLVYSVLAPGRAGPSPKDGDPVTVHYTGWLTDGTVFDSSRTRGAPARFAVGDLIPGWNEALTLMTPGARWKITIPPRLAYGVEGRPGAIPPNSTLIFDLELIAFSTRPVFSAGNPERQSTTSSGLVVQPLQEGSGDLPQSTDIVELDYALWTEKGQLLDASSNPNGQPIKMAVKDLPLAVLREGAALLRVGGRVWLKAPPALAFGDKAQGSALPAGSVTIWELSLRSIGKPLPLPAFAKTAEGAGLKLPSGLLVETVREGTGATPRLGDTVTVHYAGWLVDGTLFDASFSRGEPTSFQLGRVIQGWNEGLARMKEGGIARLTIPGPLAYGPAGAPPKIGPNATLIFYVELIKVGG